MDRLAKIIARHCRAGMVLLAVSSIIPLYFLPQARIDNSIEVWLQRDSVAFQDYRKFLDRYGSDEFVVLAGQMDDPLGDESLATQRKLAEAFSKIDAVDDVVDLPRICRMLWSDRPGWQGQARENEFLRNLLLGPDGATMGMFIFLKPMKGPQARRRTVEAIESTAEKIAQGRFEPHLAGTPLMNVALDRGSKLAAAKFMPLAIGISILALALALRSATAVLAVMCAVAVAVAWTVTVMVMTGRTFNMVTVVLPSLLFVLGLSNGIHLALRFAYHVADSGSRDAAVLATIRELLRPVFISSATTAAGFSSLMISQMAPVAEFGLFAAIGMGIAFVCNIIIVPAVLSVLHGKTGVTHRFRADHWTARPGTALARHATIVVPVATVLLAISAIVATGAQTESNVLKFFPDHSRIARDYAFVSDRLTGLYTVEVDVETAKADEATTLAAIGRLADTLADRPEVARVDHLGKFLPLFASASAAVVDRGASATVEAATFATMITKRYRHEDDGRVSLRVSVLVRAMGSGDFYSLLDFIRGQARQTLAPATNWQVTGVVSLLNDVQRCLVDTQIKSFAIAAAMVIAMIGIFFRSLRAAAASLLPNLLPIVGVFAVMAVTRIPLDAATVMIAGVAIGIAADDTIHFLARYRDERRRHLDTFGAIEATLAKIGRAVVFTSLVAAAGFTILCLADFRPIVYFGLLTGVTMLTAMAADVFVLPACIRIVRLWERR